jgi:long-chain acyl-CoA synthetase
MGYNWLRRYPKNIPHAIDVTKLSSIRDVLLETCTKFADDDAVTCMGTTLSFAQLDRLATRFAGFLQKELQVKKGDRVAIMLPNILQFPIVFIACQKLGAVCVNTNPLYTPREMQHQFRDSGATVIVILDLMLDKLEEIIKDTEIRHVIATSIGDQLPFVKDFVITSVMKIKRMIPKHGLQVIRFKDALKAGVKLRPDHVEIQPSDLALLQYTGGTTGVSKGAMLTHRNILANMEQIRLWAKDMIQEGDATVLTALPLYHIFALSVNFLAFLRMGSHMILVPKPIPIINTVKMFRKYSISLMTGVNTLFNALNNSPEFQKLSPRTMKFALAGGMALQTSVSKAWQNITGIPITEGFGLTESSPVTHCNPLFGDCPPNSIGLPLPSTVAKIVDEQGNEQPIGVDGELLIKGPQVMSGYWNRPDETAKTLRDGWLWTGDIARTDEDGFFFIVDRKKDMILVSGFNVYPNEVEQVLAEHPKVLEVAVVGVPDDSSGEAVKAFVVRRDLSLTEQELRDHCRSSLTNYKCPRFFEFKSELPKSNVGKIIRRHLRQVS